MNLIRSINFAAIMEVECSIPDSASGLPDSVRRESIPISKRSSGPCGHLARLRPLQIVIPAFTAAEGNSRNDPSSGDREERERALS